MQCRESRDAIREDLNGKREELRRLMGDNTPQQEADILQQAIATAREAEQKGAHGLRNGQRRTTTA